MLVGFAGVALVLRPTVERDQLWHGLAGLLSGVLAALAYLQVTALGRSRRARLPHRLLLLGRRRAGGGPRCGRSGAQAHSGHGALLLLAIGVLATMAQLMMTRAYAIGRTLSNAALQYTGIVFALIYGVLLFDERITPPALVGIVLIAGAGLSATLLRQRVAVVLTARRRAGE